MARLPLSPCIIAIVCASAPALAQPAPVTGIDSGAAAASAPAYPDGYPPLAGTRWNLVRYIRVDGSQLTPDAPDRYGIAFAADGTAALRLDCNRGSLSWSADARGGLTFGPLAATRAMCANMALNQRFAADAPQVRGYIVDQGHLFLALTPGGGIYEFAPAG